MQWSSSCGQQRTGAHWGLANGGESIVWQLRTCITELRKVLNDLRQKLEKLACELASHNVTPCYLASLGLGSQTLNPKPQAPYHRLYIIVDYTFAHREHVPSLTAVAAVSMRLRRVLWDMLSAALDG